MMKCQIVSRSVFALLLSFNSIDLALATEPVDAKSIKSEVLNITQDPLWKDYCTGFPARTYMPRLLECYVYIEKSNPKNRTWVLNRLPRNAAYLQSTTPQERIMFSCALTQWLQHMQLWKLENLYDRKHPPLPVLHKISDLQPRSNWLSSVISDGSVFKLVEDVPYKEKNDWAHAWWKRHSEGFSSKPAFHALVHESILDATELSFRASDPRVGERLGHKNPKISNQFSKLKYPHSDVLVISNPPHSEAVYLSHHNKEQTNNLMDR